MPLVAAVLLPHSPLLVPNIGRENRALFNSTLTASEQVKQILLETKPDLVVVITNQGPQLASSFTINIASRFTADLKNFGDLVTDWQFTGSLLIPTRCREQLEGIIPLRLKSQTGLDYASAIALSLVDTPSHLPIMPVSTMGTDLKKQYSFGKHLQSCLLCENMNIAIIGAADLSHRLEKNSPTGYFAGAKKLDQKIINALVNNKTKEILSLPLSNLNEAETTDITVIALLLGLLDGFDYQARCLSYESPFGVGHAVINYTL